MGLLTYGTYYNLDFAPSYDFQTSMSTMLGNLQCSGFTNAAAAFSTAYQTLKGLGDRNALNVLVFFTDGIPNTLTFGPAYGAGAAVLQNRPNAHGLLTAVMGADGQKSDLLFMPGGGSRHPASAQSVASRLHYLRMEGKGTFKNAVQAMTTAAEESLRRCEIDISRIKCVIPHQANRRIIEALGERLGARPDQLFVNVDKYGNTSAASVAIALDEAVTSGRVQRGDLILLIVFGAGLTWAAAVIEW